MSIRHVKAKDLEKAINQAIASGGTVKIKMSGDRKGQYRYLQSCKRKVKYGRQETALRAVIDMAEKGVGGLEAYECEFCRKWHIGHPNGSAQFIGDLENIIAAAKEKLKNL